ncbi:MAG: 4Fe-4S binding protein [Hadesarchaea archaeon]|nr:4Fe-4S binding protein [Hadesarchaea archaeon]
MTRKVLLRYSRDKAEEPILASVIRQTDVPINILHADLGAKGGEILIAIDAPEDKVEKTISLFRELGIGVEEIKKAIELDKDACIECGACVSLCPTGALSLTKDYSVELVEDKCVYCEICVPSCPVRALKLRKF